MSEIENSKAARSDLLGQAAFSKIVNKNKIYKKKRKGDLEESSRDMASSASLKIMAEKSTLLCL